MTRHPASTGILKNLLAAFPGSVLHPAHPSPILELEIGGARIDVELRDPRRGWVEALVADPPVPVIALRTVELGGFELQLVPSRRRLRAPLDPGGGEATLARLGRTLRFDEFELDRNDRGLAAAWLDVAARAALTRTLWLRGGASISEATGTVQGASARLSGCDVEIAPAALDSASLVLSVEAGAALAARPLRLARELAAELRPLGLVATSPCWDLGRDFALTGVRGSTSLRVDFVRAPELTTRLRARGLDPTDAEVVDARLTAHPALVAAAGPAQVRADAGEVELSWDGLVRTRARLGPALELAGRLVAPSRATAGPYR
jgi:hypothetical protein